MRSKLNTYLLILLLSSAGCMSPKLLYQNANEATTEILNHQVKSWNKGDLNEFMKYYWQSDSLQFIGKNGVIYGYNNTMQAYQKGYPNAEAMGKLTYEVLNIRTIDSNYAYVTGKWNVDRSAGNVNGFFTLLLRHFPEGWKIVADHSS